MVAAKRLKESNLRLIEVVGGLWVEEQEEMG
jgi:hypothetical protein